MIKYRLICKECLSSFDSWFSSSKDFEKLKRNKFLNCHKCNSKKIEKTLMAPGLIKKTSDKRSNHEMIKFEEINKKVKEYQKFIKNNFEFVGENFAYEARSIHYNNKKNNKGIYGTASKGEMDDLKEEGIEVETIPWIEDKSN